MGIPALLAEALSDQVLGILLPCVNGRLVREVCDCNSEPADVADAFGSQTAGLLERQLEHRLRHGFVATISLGPLRREYHGIVGRLRRRCETDVRLGIGLLVLLHVRASLLARGQ